MPPKRKAAAKAKEEEVQEDVEIFEGIPKLSTQSNKRRRCCDRSKTCKQ